MYLVNEYTCNPLAAQDYEVLDLLGKGGFACVFRAISKSNGREVAIKKVKEIFQSHLTTIFMMMVLLD